VGLEEPVSVVDEEVIFLVNLDEDDELEVLLIPLALALVLILAVAVALALAIDELFEMVKEDANGNTAVEQLANKKAVTPTLRSLVRLDVEDVNGKRRKCCLRLC